MSLSALEKALEAAANRLDAIGADSGAQIHAPAETMALAFVGLDVNIRELLDIAGYAVDPYAESIIAAAAHAWQGFQDAGPDTDPAEILATGADFGRHVQRNLLGVFVVAVLLGELHRSRTLEGEATSDD